MNHYASLLWLMNQPIYSPENNDEGEWDVEFFDWMKWLDVAKGNIRYARSLRERIEWQHPETLIQDDIDNGEVQLINGQYVMLSHEKEPA